MTSPVPSSLVVLGLLGVGLLASGTAADDGSVARFIDAPHRASGHAARNRYRHPVETISFFGVEPSSTVVEVWPSRGWYTEILAPFLRDSGSYVAAGFALTAKRTPAWRKTMQRDFAKKLAAHPELYDRVIVTELSIPERSEMAPAGTADFVLTFRNVHNWMAGDYAQAMFDSMYRAIKPGGVLGVVEHRAPPGTSVERMIETGYVTEAYVEKLASRAGFELLASSEVNANPKDDKNHPAGVWSLPPTLRLGDRDRERYVAIGESDRMTLKFVKPIKRRKRK